MTFVKVFVSEVLLKCTIGKSFVTIIFVGLLVMLPVCAALKGGLHNATLGPDMTSSEVFSMDTASSNNTTAAYPSIVYARAATNLSAQPKASMYRKYDLQLNVSWVPPNDTYVDDYTLEVQVLSTTHDCISKLCYEYNINKTSTWTMIPRGYSTVDGDYCALRPGCNYLVSLISHPWNGSERATLNITIPECVDRICSCAHEPMLPTPIVKANLLTTFEIPPNATALSQWNTSILDPPSTSPDFRPTYVNISWIMPSSPSPRRLPKNLRIDNFFVSLGSQKVMRYHKPWYGHDFMWQVSYNSRWCVVRANMSSSQSHLARVSVLDNRGCMGPAGNYTIPAIEKSKQSDSLWLILRPEVLVLSCALVAAIFALALRRAGLCVAVKAALDQCRKQQPSMIHARRTWLGNQQRPGDLSATWHIDVVNILYLEKEIEDKNDPWEVSPRRILIGKKIDSGAFGVVYKAKITGVMGIVALKMLNDYVSKEDTSELLQEIAMLKRAGSHPHVVRLIGCCTILPPYMALLEYAPRGSLHSLLTDARNRWIMSNVANSPSSKERFLHLVKSASSLSSSYIHPSKYVEVVQDSAGKEREVKPSVTETEYTMLGSAKTGEQRRDSQQHYVVGSGPRAPATGDCSDADGGSLESDPFDVNVSDAEDSAAEPRAPMLLDPAELHSFALQIAKGMAHLEKLEITHRDLAARNVLVDANGILKISDFGLSRNGVYEVQNPRKVPLRWLALEAIKRNLYSSKSDVWAYGIVLFEIGTLAGLPYHTLNNAQVIGFLNSGQRLGRPDSITPELYDLMLKCWRTFPVERPSFHEIVGLLELAGNRTYVDFDTLNDYVFPPTEAELNGDHKFKVVDNSDTESNPNPKDGHISWCFRISPMTVDNEK